MSSDSQQAIPTCTNLDHPLLENGVQIHLLATDTEPGLMSPEDKLKLNGLSNAAPIEGLDDVPDLVAALESKAEDAELNTLNAAIQTVIKSATAANAAISGLTEAVAQKAPAEHTHTADEISGLPQSQAIVPTYGYFRFSHAASGEMLLYLA